MAADSPSPASPSSSRQSTPSKRAAPQGASSESAPAGNAPSSESPAPHRTGDGSERTGRSGPPGLVGGLTALEAILVAGGVVLFLVLLYEMEPFLSPPLIAAAGTIMLWPLRAQRAVRAIMLSGGFLLLLWFLSELSVILVPFVAVYLLAYLFEPTVHYLEERLGVRRQISALLVTGVVVGLVALVVLLLVPNVVSQLEVLAERALGSVQAFREWLLTSALLDSFEANGLIDKGAFVAQMTTLLQNQSDRLAEGFPDVAQSLWRSIGSLFGLVTVIAVVPVVLYYTLKDYPAINRRLVELFPTFGGRRDYLVQAGAIVGNYLRGQLIICAIAGINVSFWLFVFDVPFALLLGFLAGLLNLIPTLGAIITNVLAVLVVLVFSEAWLVHLVVVLTVLFGQALLEQTVLTPKILSYQVGLHPVLILLSLLVFGYFMGIFGLLIAVPATALIVTLYKAYRSQMTLDLSSYHRPPPPWRSRSR